MFTGFVEWVALREQDADRLQLRLRLVREPRASKLHQKKFYEDSSKKVKTFFPS